MNDEEGEVRLIIHLYWYYIFLYMLRLALQRLAVVARSMLQTR